MSSFYSVEIITVYQATGPADTTEGRGPGTISYGFFRGKSAAESCASDKGVMGTPGDVRKRMAYQRADGRVYIIENETPIDCADTLEDEKRTAINKLTAREISLLGLK